MSGTRLVSRTDRLAAIEKLLFDSPIGLRAVEIADACGVDRRTIYRDLSMLAATDVPIQQRDGRFFIDRDEYKASTRLTFDEAMALLFAARIASRVQEQRNPHIAGALKKIGDALPRGFERHISAVIATESETTLDLVYMAVLDLVTRAWSERHKISFYADHSREALPLAENFSIYLIEPNEAGSLCVIGLDSASQEVLAFNLTRIRRAKISSATYKIPEKFQATRYLHGDWSDLANDVSEVNVVLLFTPEAALQLNDRQWPTRHIRDRIERQSDGSVKLTLFVPDWRELLPWIRSWGAQVEVMEPPLLRQECALEAARMDARYRPSLAR